MITEGTRSSERSWQKQTCHFLPLTIYVDMKSHVIRLWPFENWVTNSVKTQLRVTVKVILTTMLCENANIWDCDHITHQFNQCIQGFAATENLCSNHFSGGVVGVWEDVELLKFASICDQRISYYFLTSYDTDKVKTEVPYKWQSPPLYSLNFH